MRQSVATILAVMILYVQTAALTAACRTAPAKRVQESKVVVPFAVPVGVPVAPFAPYFYQRAEGRGAEEGRGSRDEGRGVGPTLVPQTSAHHAEPSSLTPRSSSLTMTHCAGCHSGATPKADLSLERLDELDDADRLQAIRAVAAGRMPQGAKLTADEIRGLIEELSAVGGRR